MLTHNRRCKTATTPVTRIGCEPGEWGLDAHNPNQARIGTSVTNGLRGMIPLGARDAATGLNFRYPRPEITDLRDVHLDINPSYELEQNLWQLGVDHRFEQATLSFIGGYQDWELRIEEDTDWLVGHELAATAENPDGFWPVSVLPPGRNALDGPVCNFNAVQAGVLGGCVLDPSQTRYSWYGQQRDWRDFYTAEVRLRTDFDGRFLVLGHIADVYGDTTTSTIVDTRGELAPFDVDGQVSLYR